MRNTPQILKEWIVYLLALLLAGCAGAGVESIPKEKVMLAAPTPARDVLFSGEESPAGYGAYGYLIFTKKPSESNKPRYLSVCDAFTRNLEPVHKYSPSVSPLLMPTFWLSEDAADVDKRFPDCKLWVENYDYARAKVIASAILLLSSKGPILVAWSQPFPKASHNETALVLDLSDFSNDDMDRAFGIWMDRIVQDRNVWHAGFNLVLAREAFRNFFEQYGEQIIRAVKTVKKTVG